MYIISECFFELNFFFLDDSNDYLTCGKCLSEFPLKNIVTFIEHKKKDCDVISIEDKEPGKKLKILWTIFFSSTESKSCVNCK